MAGSPEYLIAPNRSSCRRRFWLRAQTKRLQAAWLKFVFPCTCRHAAVSYGTWAPACLRQSEMKNYTVLHERWFANTTLQIGSLTLPTRRYRDDDASLRHSRLILGKTNWRSCQRGSIEEIVVQFVGGKRIDAVVNKLFENFTQTIPHSSQTDVQIQPFGSSKADNTYSVPCLQHNNRLAHINLMRSY